MKVVELQNNILVDLSKEVWTTLPEPVEHLPGIKLLELTTLPESIITRAQHELPFVSGKVAAFYMSPNTQAPIHIDNHDNNSYHHSLNILIEENDGNHKTFYYEVKNWNGDTLYSLGYDATDANLSRIFEMTVTKPTLFNNQQFHNIENYSGKNRLLLMWEIHKDITLTQIAEWLDNNHIDYKVLF